MKETKKKVRRSIPKLFSFNYRKVITVLMGTFDRHPISYTSLKRKTQLHDKTLSKILGDLIIWGFVEKEGKDYVVSKKNYNELRPHLERDKQEDEKFHGSWMGLPLIVAIVVLTFSIILLSDTHSQVKVVSQNQTIDDDIPIVGRPIEMYYGLIKGECVILYVPERYNQTAYRDSNCVIPYKKPFIYQP